VEVRSRPISAVAGCIVRIGRRNVLHADSAWPRAETITTAARFAAPARVGFQNPAVACDQRFQAADV
jgi:hypothetical protein